MGYVSCLITRMHFVALLFALQQGFTTPASGDTTGYWQQHVAYTITARLDESAQVLAARGTLRYVNHSPDTLRDMYVHQYLNAFRPGSRWSRDDAREGRERFQHLRNPDYAYERFTAPVRVGGVPVRVTYPGAPDSTVAHFMLPAPLPPGDSVVVDFEWNARPSTLPRRQGRRGRSWDFAQWYPKVAVYDRGGWEYNALRPAGEFYGEFGDYDVTLVLPEDQVVGATGVPVSGDPGWDRALRAGAVRAASTAYGSASPGPAFALLPGTKAVRFVAHDVHHFAWSTSPDYRYEGGVYVRSVPNVRWPTWDTVSVHVLYRPGDDTTWGGLRAVQRTINALRWLEHVYGPYAYPQMTNLHRIEGGGTEFPMMMMNGSASQGLILHEGGHNFSYGILANNEWRSGWMDEGLTSYQTTWALGGAAQERARAGVEEQDAHGTGYRAQQIVTALPQDEQVAQEEAELDLSGDAEPIGTVAHEFRDFNTYNEMIYTRAEVMYGQLRDVLGDSAFAAFLHDYYSRWALRHVDERAMRRSAERVSGRDLQWFFDQWVHRTGVTDYALVSAKPQLQPNGSWLTTATIRRRGEYAHPMPVGVRTVSGWTIVQARDATAAVQQVMIPTPDAPFEVRLDPFHTTWDWDRRDDVAGGTGHRLAFDWPFLSQSDRERSLLLFRPMAWYSEPGGVIAGIRARTSYLDWLDQRELGLVVATRDLAGNSASSADVGSQRVQGWARVRNPELPFMSRPAVGWSAGGAWLDDVAKFDLGYQRRYTVGRKSSDASAALTFANATTLAGVPEGWSRGSLLDLTVAVALHKPIFNTGTQTASIRATVGGASAPDRGYVKSEGSFAWRLPVVAATTMGLRLYGGLATSSRPDERALYLSASDPVATFYNHWWRPRGSILKQSEHWLPLGGAALRGYDWMAASDAVLAVNGELSRNLVSRRSRQGLSVALNAFGDAASVKAPGVSPRRYDNLGDAGVGLSVKGMFFDQPLTLRIDSPFYVTRPDLAIDREHNADRLAPRVVVTFSDIW
jgi:Peptidase family M1 domain